MEPFWRNHREIRYAMALLTVTVLLITTVMLYEQECMHSCTSWYTPHQQHMYKNSMPSAPVDAFSEPGLGPAGYIMVRRFSGQQGSGVRALRSLQCWAAQLPVYIVEPVIRNSTLVTRADSTNSIPFHDLFDINNFNRVALEKGVPPLVPWEYFVQNAPKHIIIVNHYGDEESAKCLRVRSEVIDDSHEGQGSNCSLNKEWLRNTELKKAGFCVRRVVSAGLECVFVTNGLEHIYKQIFHGFNPRNVVIFFKIWEAKWKPDKVDSSLSCDLKAYDNIKEDMSLWLHTSPRLLSDARRYTSMFLRGENKVAIMIRTEKLTLNSEVNVSTLLVTLNSCVQKTAELTKTLQLEHGGGGTFLALDVGKYGSTSLMGRRLDQEKERYEQVIMSAKGIVHTIYDGQWNFEDWENSFTMATGGNDNSGYIAALQRTIASQADCLVLVGWGNFHQLALGQYLKSHPKVAERCIHFICTHTSLE